MGKKDLYIPVPSFFRCPISLDVMKSPVSLSTGVTYDRASIQRWFDSGNNTCPATMQVLNSNDFVPNHTLHRLIQIWSRNHHSTKFLSLNPTQLLDLISRVSDPDTRFESSVKILCFASESLENRRFLSSNKEFVTKLVDVLASEGPDLKPNLLEAVLKIVQIITSTIDNNQNHKLLLHANPNLIPNLAKILKTGRSDSRVAVLRILESTAVEPESKKIAFENRDIPDNLLDMLKFGRRNAAEVTAALSCLKTLISPRRNKLKLIESGIIPIITDMISKSDDYNNNQTITELLITLLEMLVGCSEGRAAITENPNCIPRVVEKMMKVSTMVNEHAVAILWSLCYLFRDMKAREMMTKSNGGLTKILLLMQSDCSSNVKRMCCDLIRVFRVTSKCCLSGYDTKTTHIMPC